MMLKHSGMFLKSRCRFAATLLHCYYVPLPVGGEGVAAGLARLGLGIVVLLALGVAADKLVDWESDAEVLHAADPFPIGFLLVHLRVCRTVSFTLALHQTSDRRFLTLRVRLAIAHPHCIAV